jgi:hypothetical protein
VEVNKHVFFDYAARCDEVRTAVERWTISRKPPLKHENIGQAIVCLATQGWIDVVPDASVAEFLDELALL